MNSFDESDQAGILSSIFSLHLETHGGELSKYCEFCKNFIINETPSKPFSLESYKFIILDLNKNQHEIRTNENKD